MIHSQQIVINQPKNDSNSKTQHLQKPNSAVFLSKLPGSGKQMNCLSRARFYLCVNACMCVALQEEGFVVCSKRRGYGYD